MRRASLVLVLVAAVASPAHAEFVMCLTGQGVVPPQSSVLPPHARLVYYADHNLGSPQKITAKIDGKPVGVTKTELRSSPFKIVTIAIESDRTGTLVVNVDGRAALTWTVKPMAMPKEIIGVAGRYQGPSHTGERGESFDGLAIRLPAGTPAVLGHVRLRHDATAALWLEADVPIYTPESETRPMLRIGQFDCAANIDLPTLRLGFDLEVTVTLADGTTRTVTGLAPHLTLPTPLPPQPRPKNQRAP